MTSLVQWGLFLQVWIGCQQLQRSSLVWQVIQMQQSFLTSSLSGWAVLSLCPQQSERRSFGSTANTEEPERWFYGAMGWSSRHNGKLIIDLSTTKINRPLSANSDHIYSINFKKPVKFQAANDRLTISETWYQGDVNCCNRFWITPWHMLTYQSSFQ